MIERRVALLVLLIDQHRVALRERAALGVLARQPHRDAVLSSEQKASASAVAQSMPSPVSIALRAIVEEALHRAVDVEILGNVVILSPISLSVCDLDAGVAAARIVLVARRP